MSVSHRRSGSIGLALAAAAVLAAPAAPAIAAPDRTAPTVPSGLRVERLEHTWVALAWNPSTDNSGTVFYDATIQSPAGSTDAARAFSPTHGFGGLTPGTTYTVSVRAVDPAGNTSASVSVQVTTPARTLPPPTTPANLRGVYVDGRLDRIAWDAATHGTPVSYLLRSGETVLSAVSGTSVSIFHLVHIDCAVDPGGTYTLTVQALSQDNDVSARSAPLTVTIPLTVPAS